MKVLCPIDFSEASINAAIWIASLLEKIDGSELQLTHFIYIMRRASMFLSVEDVFLERAKADMDVLVGNLNKSCPDLHIKSTIYKAHPKEAIVSLAKDDNYDLIVTGTTGLTALKNMTVGSVTEHVMRHSKTPVLAIPEDVNFKGVNKIALSVDDEIIERLSSLAVLRDLCVETNATLHLIHIHEKKESPFEYDPGIDMFLRDMKFKYERLDMLGSIPKTINNYCHENEMDILCMVHHKRNWIQKIIQKSITKSELFKLEFPLLILPEL